MLVLSRHVNESIVLRDSETDKVIATLVIVAIRGDKARLGIHASNAVKILRKELDDKEQREIKLLFANTVAPGTDHDPVTE